MLYHAIACITLLAWPMACRSRVCAVIEEQGQEWAENRARWKQLYDILRDRIERGVYKPERAVPSLSQLHQEFGLAPNTIRKALDRLRREKFIHAEHGVGTFVRPREEWSPPEDEEA